MRGRIRALTSEILPRDMARKRNIKKIRKLIDSTIERGSICALP
jgi:hypothetical protein